MSTRNTKQRRPPAKRGSSRTSQATRQRRIPFVPIAGGVVIVAALFAIFLASRSSSSSGGGYPCQVGAPGSGKPAPAVHLTATNGSTFDLNNERGKTVLLYFQEGVGCEPCWKQISDIEGQRASFTAAHVDEIVSITTDPMSTLRQKVTDEHVTIPVFSDPDLSVSRSYNANRYGMMGTSTDGHTFVLVGPDGTIRWRADYGGEPNYTMYVPVDHLLADLNKGTG